MKIRNILLKKVKKNHANVIHNKQNISTEYKCIPLHIAWNLLNYIL